RVAENCILSTMERATRSVEPCNTKSKRRIEEMDYVNVTNGVLLVVVIAFIILLSSSFFTIQSAQAGIVQRFGKFQRIATARLEFQKAVPGKARQHAQPQGRAGRREGRDENKRQCVRADSRVRAVQGHS